MTYGPPVIFNAPPLPIAACPLCGGEAGLVLRRDDNDRREALFALVTCRDLSCEPPGGAYQPTGNASRVAKDVAIAAITKWNDNCKRAARV